MIVTGNVVFVFILTLLLCLTSYASGEYESREMSKGGSNDGSLGKDFGSCNGGKCIKRTTQEISSGMWFGPRLGRRRRSDEKPEVNPEAIEALANALDDTHWTLIKIPANNKRQPTQFTPRLGRGSGEELYFYGDALERNEEDDYPLSSYFKSSRIGRRLPWTPSPRLGRQLRSVLRNI